MKHLLLVLDGAADEPLAALEGKTPLMAASTPHLRDMTKRGRVGAVRTLWEEWEADPEAALLGLFGYPPAEHFHGRGPLEAASLQIDLDGHDLAFRMDLVQSDGERLLDATAGRIGAAEGRTLVEYLAQKLRIRTIQFYPGSGYRNVLVWRDGPAELRTRNPRAIVGEALRPNFPEGDRSERLHQVIWDSYELLSGHPVNRRRVDEGKPPATMIWPWSGGRPGRLPAFGPLHGMGGAVVAGTDLVRGLGRLAGLEVIPVPSATGSLDTDYKAKALWALRALETYDFAAVHVEAPNEAALDGDYEAKVDALERIDERLVGTLLDRIGKLDDFRMLAVPDHVTSCARRSALPGWVPFLLAGNLVKRTGPRLPFDERAAEEADWRIDEPWHLLTSLFEAEA
jgi:2,3-bisphosphoglycerate-independent phosphoglycerate mutase